jgi:hypothetical protein
MLVLPMRGTVFTVYVIEMVSGGMIYIPSFMTIGSVIQGIILVIDNNNK